MTSLLWRGLTLATGETADYRITSIEGWEELPPSRYDKTPRARAHGAHPSPVWADERIVTVQGFTPVSDQRDTLLAALRSGLGGFTDVEYPLTITDAGRTLTASAQLLRAAPIRRPGEWGVGRFGWAAQWRCPDPLRYGQPQSLSTGLPTSGGGLEYPLTYPLDYGDPGDPGRVTLTNPGTADAPILLAVTGPLDAGFEVSAGGRRLTYPTEVPAGQVITLDTATGHVLAEGTADRRGELTYAEWFSVPAGGSLALQFTSLGGYDPAARLDATWAEAHW